MTERLYYSDSYLWRFSARVLELRHQGSAVVLDRTAFYPASGGQPHDTGTVNGIRVLNVEEDDGGRIVHHLAAPLEAEIVEGVVDEARRFDHMQQHSGQHLLSAVFEELFHYPTLSFHLGPAASTIELGAPEISDSQLADAEKRANRLIAENRALTVTFEDAAQTQGLRKASEREGTLRIVNIAGLDRSACGGTHVRATGEIGVILLRGLEKIRGNTRLEFLCGLRAVARSRQEHLALTRIGRGLSAAPLDTPELVAQLQDQAKEADKQRRKLALEIATYVGRQQYLECAPGPDGIRRRLERHERGPLPEDVRSRATAFTAGPNAVFVALTSEPATVLLAASADSGLHAGNKLKELLAAVGGRGGGGATMAQGSIPDPAALEQIAVALSQL
jgi:alanyl-tRNA synthetase